MAAINNEFMPSRMVPPIARLGPFGSSQTRWWREVDGYRVLENPVSRHINESLNSDTVLLEVVEIACVLTASRYWAITTLDGSVCP